MKKMVGILRPFEYKQRFFVYEDGNKLDNIETTVEELVENVLQLAFKHEINQIDLSGPKQYALGLGQKIKEASITKYNHNNITINII